MISGVPYRFCFFFRLTIFVATMFDILVYLFENYAQPGHFPAVSVLARKLTAVGFESDDISAALKWLADLESTDVRVQCGTPPRDPGAIRLYAEREQARLPVACRGFLSFLEQAGAIDGPLREMIVEQAFALGTDRITLARLKIIVLMVLWRRHPAIESVNALLLDELLTLEAHTPCLH